MALNLLSLPSDIPWKRLAISDDMYAVSPDLLPAKWRSSVAVYSYDPTPDPAELDDRGETTTFLKVVVTITGYAPGVRNALTRVGRERRDFATLKGASAGSWLGGLNELDTYYPAYAANLQVAVFPEGGDWAIGEYPYFSDFEPKKRELIELVTETGEQVTQNVSDLNVRKGMSTTDSTENVNIDHGGSTAFSVQAGYAGASLGVGGARSQQQEVGSRTKAGSEDVNILSTDKSREKRETYSHTTNLSHLWQLLDSYHAGTNRALFFVNARPHLNQSVYTFVNGPRRLEGIQEFFLVVRRPREMESICVDALLETAHLHETVRTYQTGTTRYAQSEITQSFTSRAVRANGGYAEESVEKWRIDIPLDQRLDRSRGGGPISMVWGGGVVCNGYLPAGVVASWGSLKTQSGSECDALPRVTAYDNHVEIELSISGSDEDDGSGDYTFTVYTESIEPVETPQTKTDYHVDLFLNALEVTSCRGRVSSRDYISFERDVTGLVGDELQAARGNNEDAPIAANSVARTIRDQVALSVASVDRYRPGEVSFLTSSLALRALLTPDRRSFAELENVSLAELAPDDLRDRVSESGLSVADALATTPERLAGRLEVTPVEARELVVSAIAEHAGTEARRQVAASSSTEVELPRESGGGDDG
jgi:hypothetical protein